MTRKEQDARTAFEMMGFNEEQTGGGCTAWTMTINGGREVLVTDGEASSVLDIDQPCKMFVVSDGGETLKVFVFLSGEALMSWLDRLCKSYDTSSSKAIERYIA